MSVKIPSLSRSHSYKGRSKNKHTHLNVEVTGLLVTKERIKHPHTSYSSDSLIVKDQDQSCLQRGCGYSPVLESPEKIKEFLRLQKYITTIVLLNKAAGGKLNRFNYRNIHTEYTLNATNDSFQTGFLDNPFLLLVRGTQIAPLQTHTIN